MKTIDANQIQHTEKSIPINRKELIRRLGSSAPTIIRLEKKGVIPVLRLGGKVLYDWNKVMESLERQDK